RSHAGQRLPRFPPACGPGAGAGALASPWPGGAYVGNGRGRMAGNARGPAIQSGAGADKGGLGKADGIERPGSDTKLPKLTSCLQIAWHLHEISGTLCPVARIFGDIDEVGKHN